MERLDRLERLTNLVLVLLDAPRPLTLGEISDTIGGYPPPGEARRRSFERDKRLLREEGIPVTTVAVDGPEQFGYRILASQYYLPDLDLTTEEQVALNLAVSGVHLEGSSGRSALLKLGILASEEGMAMVTVPTLPALAVLDRAARQHAVVSFGYRSERREVEPHFLLARGGQWYLVGLDRGRGGRRTFRVDRIEGQPEMGDPGGFEPPDDLADARLKVPWQIGDGEVVRAEVVVDAVATPQALSELGPEALVERRPDGSGRFAVGVSNPEAFVNWALGLLDRAEVVSPPSLRQAIRARLEAVVESGAGAVVESGAGAVAEGSA